MLTDRNVLQGWQSDRLNLLFLLSLGLLVLGAGLGLRDPWPADEPLCFGGKADGGIRAMAVSIPGWRNLSG